LSAKVTFLAVLVSPLDLCGDLLGSVLVFGSLGSGGGVLHDGVDLVADRPLVDGDLGVVRGPLCLHEVLVHEGDVANDESEDDDRGADDGEADDVHPGCSCLELS
jgi:hypothetical protein